MMYNIWMKSVTGRRIFMIQPNIDDIKLNCLVLILFRRSNII